MTDDKRKTCYRCPNCGHETETAKLLREHLEDSEDCHRRAIDAENAARFGYHLCVGCGVAILSRPVRTDRGFFHASCCAGRSVRLRPCPCGAQPRFERKAKRTGYSERLACPSGEHATAWMYAGPNGEHRGELAGQWDQVAGGAAEDHRLATAMLDGVIADLHSVAREGSPR